MPHITKHNEKIQCVKMLVTSVWDADLKLKYVIPEDGGISLTMIDKILEEMNIKEVPYGRHNSDTNYRRS